jgi:beta-N-acetylhexosaminidase
MPGHGRAGLDSHKALPSVAAPLADLQAHDFIPFKALNDLPMAMTAHIVYTAIDAENPATTSAKMVGVMRDDIGFGGLIMSDDLSMNALSGTLGERAAATIAAGVDIALHCNGDAAEMASVVAGAGTLTTAAAARADHALAARHIPETVDIAALQADLSRYING